MPKQILSLDTIGDVDNGGLRIEFNNAIRLLVQDMADRPGLERPRTLVLEIELQGAPDDETIQDEADRRRREREGDRDPDR